MCAPYATCRNMNVAGDAARRLFKEAYGSGFIDVGVGKILDTEELR